MGSNPYNAVHNPPFGNVLVTGHPSYNFVILSDEQIQRFPDAGHTDPTGGTLKIDTNSHARANGISTSLLHFVPENNPGKHP